MERNLCFIVMGFGKKKDPDTNRTIDLDATYKKIIRPAVESAGCKCIRADEIVESGIIGNHNGITMGKVQHSQ